MRRLTYQVEIDGRLIDLSPWARFVACDASGVWFEYSAEPVNWIGARQWFVPEEEMPCRFGVLAISTSPANWAVEVYELDFE